MRYDVQAKGFNQGLDLNDKEHLPDDRHDDLQIPFVDFDQRGDKNNIGPRLGLAWDVNEGRSVVRAGYGIYYNPMNLVVTSRASRRTSASRTSASRTRRIRIRTGAGSGERSRRRRRRTSRSWTTTSRTCSRTLPRSGFSQELSSTLAIHVDGVYNRMTKIPLTMDINPRSGLTTGPRPLPQFARIDQTAVHRRH